jgi:hypothetical protein
MFEYSVKLLSENVAEITVDGHVAGYLIMSRSTSGMKFFRMLDNTGTPITEAPYGGYTVSIHKVVRNYLEV